MIGTHGVGPCRVKTVVTRLLQWCESHQEYANYGFLFLVAYAFLLRLPSEALPIQCGLDGGDGRVCLLIEGNKLALVLRRRKNKPEGSRLVRGCWCRESKVTCPFHRLAPVLQKCQRGQKLFEGITPAKALGVLRLMLAAVGVGDADAYRTHDLRRGHALDLQLSGTCALHLLSVWLQLLFVVRRPAARDLGCK